MNVRVESPAPCVRRRDRHFSRTRCSAQIASADHALLGLASSARNAIGGKRSGMAHGGARELFKLRSLTGIMQRLPEPVLLR